MAIEPPLPAAPQAVAPAPPTKKSGCAGCSVGCLGCLGAILVVILLLVGGGYFFFVAQAQAGIASPAALLVATSNVEVGHNDTGYVPPASGQSLHAGTSGRPDHPGPAALPLPARALTRPPPDTTATIQGAQLDN